jgi:hypothetical protein
MIAIIIPLVDDKERSLHKVSSIPVLRYFGGGIVYITLVSTIKVNPYVLYWTLFAAMFIFCLVLWATIGKYIISLCTSIAGAYLIVRSIGIYYNNYPDEEFVSNLVRKGEVNQIRRIFSKAVIIYFCLIVGLCILGTIYQGVTDDDKSRKYEKEKRARENDVSISNNNL